MANHVLPGVYETITDGNLNLVTSSPTNTVLKLGLSTSGTVNTPQAFGSQNAMLAALGAGALTENLAYQLSVAGSPVLAMPVNRSIAGSFGNGSRSGTGTGTFSVSAAPVAQVAVKVVTGGASGTFAIALGSGSYGTPVTFPGSPFKYSVPGTFTDLTFSSNGSTFVTNDVYTIGVDGYISQVGSGAGTITQSSSPVRNWTPAIAITSGGTTGSSPLPQFTYSLDGSSANVSPVVQLTSSNRYGIEGSGIALTFAGTFNTGDGYSFGACGPSFSNTDLTSALNAVPLNLRFSMLEAVREAMLQNSVAAATEANTVSLSMSSFFSNGIYARGIISCPTINGSSVGFSGGSISTVGGVYTVDSVDTDGYVISSFQNFSDARVSVAAGDCLLVSPVSGLSVRCPASWVESAKLAAIPPAQSAAWAGDPTGSLKGVTLLYRDEALTPGLSDGSGQRFTTLRTLQGAPGFWFTNCLSMAQLTSDFSVMTNCRVIDKASDVSRQWALPLIFSNIATTTDKSRPVGSIANLQANQLDNSLTSALSTSMVPNDCVAAKGTVDRSHNIGSDKTLPFTVGVQPYVGAEFIEIELGLVSQI